MWIYFIKIVSTKKMYSIRRNLKKYTSCKIVQIIMKYIRN